MSALTFQVLRALSHEQFTSGQTLAERFGVTRAAISAALKHCDALGVQVFALTRKGYQLATPLDLIQLERVREAMVASAPRIDLDVVDVIDSTNTELLRRLAAGAPSGAALVAELQTQGRGRRGRVWQSQLAGSLAFSVLWRFEMGMQALGALSLAVGLAVQRALGTFGLNAQLKWPNDIWLDGKKCGGILIESQGEMTGPMSTVIGIGLNVRLSDAALAAIDQPTTDLSRHGAAIDRSALLGALLRELVQVFDAYARSGFAPMKDEWTAAHALHGAVVNILDGVGRTRVGVVRDVGIDGMLVVEIAGQRVALSSEEISLRPVARAR